MDTMSCIICGGKAENGVCYAINDLEIRLCPEHSGLIPLRPVRFILS